MEAYPVTFECDRPVRYERVQVVLRLLILGVLSLLGGSLGWIYLFAYLVFPLVATLWMRGRSPEQFLADRGPVLVRGLRALLGFFAYLGYLTDEAPGSARSSGMQLEVAFEGRPSTGSALLRLVTSLPAFLVGALLGLLGIVLSVVCAVFVLIREQVPAGLYDAQRGIVRWQARLFAYHASLVDRAPPFSFDGASHALAPGAA